MTLKQFEKLEIQVIKDKISAWDQLGENLYNLMKIILSRTSVCPSQAVFL